MAQSTTDPWMWAISRRGHSRFARAALVGGVLPVVLALVNQRLVARMVTSYETGPTVLACAAMLAEIAAVGFLCAKFIDVERWRWVAYVWMWALLVLMVEPRVVDGIWWGHPMALLAPTLLSVQLVLFAIWAVFGSARWSIRWPVAGAMLVIGAGVPMAAHAYGARRIAWLVVSQTVVFLAACLVLYWRGNRIRIGGSGSQFDSVRYAVTSKETNKTQFFMRDVLIWTTLAATLLALARAFDLLSAPRMSMLREFGVAMMCLTGAISALVHVAALSAMLGREWALVRWGRLAAGGVLAVVLLGVGYRFSFAWRVFTTGSAWETLLSSRYWMLFLSSKWHLLGLVGLSASMLIASLVFLRVQGYRMINKRGET